MEPTTDENRNYGLSRVGSDADGYREEIRNIINNEMKSTVDEGHLIDAKTKSTLEEEIRLIDTDIKRIIDEEMQKAAQEIKEEYKKAMRQVVEEHKSMINKVVQEEKEAIWAKIESLKKSILKLDL